MLADAHLIRSIQTDLTGRALGDLDTLMGHVASLAPETARDLLIETLPSVAQTYGDLNAVAAGEWFEDLRVREVGAGRSAILAKPVPFDQVEASIRFSAEHLFTGDVDGMTAYLRGALTRWVNEPARMTIIDSIDADPIGYGWQRVVRPGGCDFCQMLADRGGVYTRKSVWFASHNSCNCGAVPSWDSSLPEVDVMAYTASKRMQSIRDRAAGPPSKEQRQAQEILDDHRSRIRDWIATTETNPT